MADGYIAGKRPDESWWLDRIYEGMEYRKRVAFEERWPIWHAYSRGDWNPNIMPVNLFFAMMRTIVPRVYFRDPSVSVVSTKPGPIFMGFAKLLERTDTKLIRQMRLKKRLKQMVQDTFLYGTSIGTLGYGSVYEYEHEGRVEAPSVRQGERLEYQDYVVPNMPWFGRVHPRSFVVPDGVETHDVARWDCTIIERPTMDVKEDPRFSRSARQKVGAGRFRSSDQYKIGNRRFSRSVERYETTELAVIRDKKTQKVIVLAAATNSNKPLVMYDGPDLLQINGFPNFPLIFNPDNEYFWGIPDSKILEPYQLEMNEIRTQNMKHRRLSLIKLLVRKGMIDVGEMQKLYSEDVAAVVSVNGDPNTAAAAFKVAGIPQELFEAGELVLRDARDTVGFSRNAFGEYNSQTAETTATEANIVRQGSEIRVDERKDAVADLLVDIIEGMNNIIFQKWSHTEVAEVVGPGGVPIWVSFTPQMLKAGQYHVKVDPDSSVPETKQAREAKAASVYELLKSNPIIDPFKLTQYLLHELHGTAFDDMMRALPPAMGAAGQTMNALDYGQVLQQSIGSQSGQDIAGRMQNASV